MARRKEAADQLKAERKSEIRAASLRLFATKGYHATGVMDIAKEVGITHGTIYLYYKTKEEILVDVITYGFTHSVALFEETTAQSVGQPPLERLRRLVTIMLCPTKDDAYFLRVAMQVYGLDLGQQPGLHGMSTVFWQRIFDQMVPLVEAGQAAGAIKAGNAWDLVSLLAAVMPGYIVMYGDGTDYPIHTHADLLISLLETR